jgi:hypothetical protein
MLSTRAPARRGPPKTAAAIRDIPLIAQPTLFGEVRHATEIRTRMATWTERRRAVTEPPGVETHKIRVSCHECG